MSKVKIIYGSAGGNTELVCEKVKAVLEELKVEITLIRAKTATKEDLNPMKGKGFKELLILAGPTYGDGILEDFMDKFIRKSKGVDLKDRPVAIIALGDNKYNIDYIVESAKILDTFAKEHGARIFCSPLLIVKNPIPHLNKRVQKWTEKLAQQIKEEL
jgi:flavodoxin